MSRTTPTAPRLLIVPGLHDSGPGHWQTWLEHHAAPALRVRQDDFTRADLPRWSARIAATLDRAGGDGPWIVVAHSFGVLALVHHLAARADTRIAAALLVAPADPVRFGVADALPHGPLPCPATLVASDDDPWLTLAEAQRWSRRWNIPLVNLGAVGHINVESGHGTLPLASQWVAATRRRLAPTGQEPERSSETEYRVAI